MLTSAGIGLDLTEEVNRFFSQPKITDYRALVDLLVRRFEDFAVRSASLNPIYRVYTRGTKQGGEELKERWKIAEKVSLSRMGKRKNSDGSLRDVPPKPAFPINHLGDIVGLTVVCIFPSDISTVMAHVQDLVSRHELLQFDSEPKKEAGYYAHHYVLGLPDLRFGEAYRCEVQIKTLLHDAWSAKTHNLTYKPEAELDNRLNQQMNHLGDALNAIDQMSEVLKTLITERWKIDHVRKNAARTALLLRLREVRRPPPDRAGQFDEILNELEAKREVFSTAPRSEVDTMIDRIRTFAAGAADDYDSCRMMAALACMRKDDDLDNLALYYIERWVAAAADARAKYESLLFQGLVLYCFGRLEEAVNVTREALRIAQESGRQRSIARAAGNVAYYYAEMGSSELGRKLNAAAEARKYVPLYQTAILEADATVTGASDLSDDERRTQERAMQADRAKLKDTTGLVLIAFGESPDDIREGLRLCTEAKVEDPYKDVADAFFDLHERHAFRRLLSWP